MSGFYSGLLFAESKVLVDSENASEQPATLYLLNPSTTGVAVYLPSVSARAAGWYCGVVNIGPGTATFEARIIPFNANETVNSLNFTTVAVSTMVKVTGDGVSNFSTATLRAFTSGSVVGGPSNFLQPYSLLET